MKIVVENILIPFYRIKFFLQLKTELGSSEFNVICGDKTFAADTADQSHALEFARRTTTMFFFNRNFYYLKGFITEIFRSDIMVVTFSLRNLNMFAAIAAKIFFSQKKLIMWGHIEGSHVSLNIIRKLVMRLNDGFICYTESDAMTLKEPFYGLTTKTCSLGNSLYSVSDFLSIRKITNYKKKFDVLNLVYSGRIIGSKMVEELIDTFVVLLNAENSVVDKLHIIGEGGLKNKMIEKVQKLNLEEKIIFHGYVDKIEDLALIYNQCHISVSYGYLGLNVIQSFAFGLPMIYNESVNNSPEVEACIDGINSFSFCTSADFIQKFSLVRKILPLDNLSTFSVQDYVCQNYNVDQMALNFYNFITNDLKS